LLRACSLGDILPKYYKREIKSRNFLKYPAKHLNEIFVDTEKLEEANNPKIVKHKRRHQILKEDDQNFQRYEEISSNSSDDAEDVISSKKRKKLLFHQCQRIILK